ncbi:hypothetical protein AcV5_009633 [Taiwanofungus camphoratus]|nr:hypothetical protein AcV5_009633 [Antrodia cinnamomea]
MRCNDVRGQLDGVLSYSSSAIVYTPSPCRAVGSPSFVFGYNITIAYQENTGSFGLQNTRDCRFAWRVKDCLGQDILTLADLKVSPSWRH